MSIEAFLVFKKISFHYKGQAFTPFLIAWPLVEELFFAASLTKVKQWLVRLRMVQSVIYIKAQNTESEILNSDLSNSLGPFKKGSKRLKTKNRLKTNSSKGSEHLIWALDVKPNPATIILEVLS